MTNDQTAIKKPTDGEYVGNFILGSMYLDFNFVQSYCIICLIYDSVNFAFRRNGGFFSIVIKKEIKYPGKIFICGHLEASRK